MWQWLSLIVTDRGRMYYGPTNSYEELVEALYLRDDGVRPGRFVRVEVLPARGDKSVITIAETSGAPDWWPSVTDKALLALARRLRPAWAAYAAVVRHIPGYVVTAQPAT